MQNRLLRIVGYFFIWGDFYLLLFGVHSLFVGAVDFGFYLQEYFQAARALLDWFASWNPITLYCVSFFYEWPAALVFLSRFTISTLIGLWLVKRFSWPVE